jgi:hypothetical protein
MAGLLLELDTGGITKSLASFAHHSFCD